MPAALVKTIADDTGITLAEAEKRWRKAKVITTEEKGLSEADGEDFWRYVTGVFKKSMGISAVLESAGRDFSHMSRPELQKIAKKVGIPGSYPKEKLAHILTVLSTEPRYWSRADFQAVAIHLSIHQDVRPGSEERTDSIASEGLRTGMVDGVDKMARNEWTWAKGLLGGDAYIFISGSLQYKGPTSPYLAPGNKPLIHFKPQNGQDLYEALRSTGKLIRGTVKAIFESATAEEVHAAAHEAATSHLNDLPQPTEAMLKAGNYAKGHLSLQGLQIAIENPKGSTRRGVDQDGKAWESTMQHHYGYLKGTIGRDKDHLDVFIGDHPESEFVFVVDQVDPKTRRFDEHKIMLGFTNTKEARAAYLANYAPGWKGLAATTGMTMAMFKIWLNEMDTTKPMEDTVLESAGPKQPWQMTAAEWEREREAVRPNNAQSNFTKASGSQAVAAANRLSFLLYGVRDADKERLDAATAGKIKLERDEVDDILERLNTPVYHQDVVAKAVSEGKPVPAEVLADYPDLTPSYVTRIQSATSIDDIAAVFREMWPGIIDLTDNQKEGTNGASTEKEGAMKTEVEVSRQNVTVAEFFRAIKAACEKKGMSFDLDRETFENPTHPSNDTYTVRDGIKYARYGKGEPTREYDGSDAAAKSETSRVQPYDYQTYILNHDGSMFNEICEFTFTDEKRGTGYYYQASRDANEGE